ncbi:hypothetical protein RB614_26990 [Phytohabitans sp. ZYX-F-186]|uniref:Uncharacterized protein n=1 Tax=Phytohabitans maris TaxID=3071409 RepID=A0ABU0ZP57_9ACTN|nr:hypothetical protein [Phytohabitans sp. ZYX-F-186]MDQ7908177.1 hypothetical protein [Phytohabitans sp. ZYX-F-186]
MLNLRDWKARRAERRAARIAAQADRAARRAARESERIANQGRDASAAGPWTNGGAGA